MIYNFAAGILSQMSTLHKLEQPGVGVLYQCWECGWESMPMELGSDEPEHICPTCQLCNGKGRYAGTVCPDCQGTGKKQA
jgi:DNA-directed RNA polymerase subunit RPC12/RpoP